MGGRVQRGPDHRADRRHDRQCRRGPEERHRRAGRGAPAGRCTGRVWGARRRPPGSGPGAPLVRAHGRPLEYRPLPTLIFLSFVLVSALVVAEIGMQGVGDDVLDALVVLGGVPLERPPDVGGEAAVKTGSCDPSVGASPWMHHATFDLVWLGVLILTPGVGVPAGPVCPAFPLRFRLGLSAGGRVRPVGVVPGWPGTAGTRPAPTASAAEGASGGGGRSGPAEPVC